jgi:hypothetical protein
MKLNTLRLFLAGLLSILSAASLAGAAGEITVDAIEASLAEKGPRATLEAYFSCEKYDGSAYPAIAGGSREWVSLAEKMIAHSDACYMEGIQAALGEAMRKSPRNVLRLVDKTPALGADHICLPFISSEQSIAAQVKELRKSRRAISAVRDRQLSKPRAACLRFIRGVEKSLPSTAAQAEQKAPPPVSSEAGVIK